MQRGINKRLVEGGWLSSLNHNTTKCYSTITVLGPIKYQTLASRLFAKPKCPATQTFAQIVQFSTFFPPLPLKNSRSHEWHYGIISGWKLCRRLPYRKQLPTYLMNDAHALPSPFSISFPCGLDTRACIKFYLGINTFWREYQDSFPQTTVCGYIHYDVFLVQIHISMRRKNEIRTATP